MKQTVWSFIISRICFAPTTAFVSELPDGQLEAPVLTRTATLGEGTLEPHTSDSVNATTTYSNSSKLDHRSNSVSEPSTHSAAAELVTSVIQSPQYLAPTSTKKPHFHLCPPREDFQIDCEWNMDGLGGL
jgi:hypothetical protein